MPNPSFGQQLPQHAALPDIRLSVLAGDSPTMEHVRITTKLYGTSAPKAPTGLAVVSDDPVTLTWNTTASGLKYNVYRRNFSSGAFGPPIAQNVTVSGSPFQWTDPAAVPGNYYSYVVTAVDSGGRESGISFDVSVGTNTMPRILTTVLPDATWNREYEVTLSAGGNAPFAWTVVDGSLPSGLTLSANGTLSGTPGVLGLWDFTVQVEDMNGSTNTQEYSLLVMQRLFIFADDFEDDTPLNATNSGLGIRPDDDGAGEDAADVGSVYSSPSGEYQIRVNPEQSGNTSSHVLFMNQIGSGTQDDQFIDGFLKKPARSTAWKSVLISITPVFRVQILIAPTPCGCIS
ncbi:MAG: hypothetical protein HC901_00540 [Bdellovibrionaceae bacterium]|nr:hypothetical protein [Pseudobdellovibrionaceae bacterium]